MARRLLRNEILGKTVMTANGSVLGVLEEMVLDTETGEIKYILVRSDNNRATGQKIDSDSVQLLVYGMDPPESIPQEELVITKHPKDSSISGRASSAFIKLSDTSLSLVMEPPP